MVPAPFIVLLDANVLFPFSLRDTLLRAAAAGLYRLRWPSRILDETTRNLVSTGTMPVLDVPHATARITSGARIERLSDQVWAAMERTLRAPSRSGEPTRTAKRRQRHQANEGE